MPNKHERRENSRVEIIWPIDVETDQRTIEGETRNISSSGLYTYCEEPLQVNKIYRLAVYPQNRVEMGVSGKVVWSESYDLDDERVRFGIGIEIIEISDEDRMFLYYLSKNSEK